MLFLRAAVSVALMRANWVRFESLRTYLLFFFLGDVFAAWITSRCLGIVREILVEQSTMDHGEDRVQLDGIGEIIAILVISGLAVLGQRLRRWKATNRSSGGRGSDRGERVVLDRRDPEGNGVTLLVDAKVDWNVTDLVEVLKLQQLQAGERDVLLLALEEQAAGCWVRSQRDEPVASLGERYF